ncbi:uncharacterized protein LOC119646901 [Hermetia illucens]|uniref:uncharacterized protein LOC119646901 n=1 Tax=Hermetia illucens TaxID=343691 RepID=UPI0018CC4473|nr:uncharacterized protein LOC119646901 [Hermetia illucens]
MKLYIILGCMMQCCSLGLQKNLNSLKITKVECIPNNHWVGDVECFLKPLRNRSIQLQAKMPVKRTINSVKFHIQIFRWYSGFRPYLVDFWFDFCDVVSKSKNMNPLLRPFYMLITTYSTLKHPCPIEGLVEVPPAVPDLSVFPSMLVTGVYLLNITAVEKNLNEWIFTFRVKAEVTSDLKE